MASRTLSVALAASVAAAGGWLLTVGPAYAGEQPAAAGGQVSGGQVSVRHFRHGFRATGAAPQALHPRSLHDDSFWAGYTVTGTTYESVTATWTVPNLTCSTTQDSYTSPWVGIDGWGTSTVEQIGIDNDCFDGQVIFAPWVEMYPADSIYFDEVVKPGDKITASVTFMGGGNYQLAESDATQGWSKTYSLTATGAAKRTSAEAIFEDLGENIPPVAQFSPLEFTDVQADGAPLADGGELNETDLVRGSTQLTENSALNGDAFTVSWLHT